MKGWRTIVVNVLLGILYLAAWQPITQWVDPQYLVLATGAINMILRFITTSPVGKAE